MTFNRYIYGTIAAAFVAGGTAIYYANRPYEARAIDEIEIAEAILERSAATSNWPFVYTVTNVAGWNATQKQGGYIAASTKEELIALYEVSTWAEVWAALLAEFGTEETVWDVLELYFSGVVGPQEVTVKGTNSLEGITNWSFNPFPGAPLIGSGPSRDRYIRYMQQIENLAPRFVQSVSNGTPIYYTLSKLWTAASIGNGTACNWTVWVTNGACGYGPATNLSYFSQSNVLWEMCRALRLMTTTVRTATWQAGPLNEFQIETAWFFDPYPYEMIAANPVYGPPAYYPSFWTNMDGHAPVMAIVGSSPYDYLDPTLDGSRLVYSNIGTAVSYPYEAIWFSAPSGPVEIDVYDDFESPGYYWHFTWPNTYAEESAFRLDSSGGVWIANLSAGVTVSVSQAWSSTGMWTRVSTTDGTNVTRFSEAGTSVSVVACSGVATSWAGLAVVTGYHHKVTDFVAVSNEIAYGYWTNTMRDNGQSVPPGGEYVFVYPPLMTGTNRVDLVGQSILNWTFTRCK